MRRASGSRIMTALVLIFTLNSKRAGVFQELEEVATHQHFAAAEGQEKRSGVGQFVQHAA